MRPLAALHPVVTLLVAADGGSGDSGQQPRRVVPLVALPNLSFTQFAQRLDFLPLPYNDLNKTWAFSVSVCDVFTSRPGMPSKAFFSTEAVAAASNKHGGMLTAGLECAGIYEQVHGTTTGAVAEWGQEFSAMDYVSQPTALCVNLSLPSLKKLHGTVPRSREEALALMQAYFTCRTSLATAPPGNQASVVELTGNMLFGAFAAAMGRVSVVATELIPPIGDQEHIAFARGTARQFHLPWAVDVSPWFQKTLTDYSTAQFWKGSSDPHGGHSLSMYNRSYYTAFMSGTNQLIAEAGGVNLFLQQLDSDGVMELSPLGEVAADFSRFVRSRKERGIPYVPVAIVLEHAHGFGMHIGNKTLCWNSIGFLGSTLCNDDNDDLILMEMFSKKPGVLNLILRDSDSGLQQNTENTSCAKSGVGLTALWRGATPPFFGAIFILETISLPRQARDKHI
jgi:hypothetical protein